MSTPALKKDTIWYQIFLFLAGLVAYLQAEPLVIETLGTNVGLLAMASSVIAIALSFTKPRPSHTDRLNKLDEHEDESI